MAIGCRLAQRCGRAGGEVPELPIHLCGTHTVWHTSQRSSFHSDHVMTRACTSRDRFQWPELPGPGEHQTGRDAMDRSASPL